MKTADKVSHVARLKPENFIPSPCTNSDEYGLRIVALNFKWEESNLVRRSVPIKICDEVFRFYYMDLTPSQRATERKTAPRRARIWALGRIHRYCRPSDIVSPGPPFVPFAETTDSGFALGTAPGMTAKISDEYRYSRIDVLHTMPRDTEGLRAPKKRDFVVRSAHQKWGYISRALASACVTVLIFGDLAISNGFQAGDTEYMATMQAHDKRFITAMTRLTVCKITFETDIRAMVPLYPADSRRRHEEGKVIMQLLIDADSCVRKATILQSSGYFRLDKASLDFAMNLKLSASLLSKMRNVEDGQPSFALPIEWKLTPAIAYVPGDPCWGGTRCIDEAPPSPKAEATGAPPEPGDTWMPGYYVHYAKTGYQWNDGQWGPPHPGYHWNAPHWDQFRSKWLFVAGGWEPDK